MGFIRDMFSSKKDIEEVKRLKEILRKQEEEAEKAEREMRESAEKEKERKLEEEHKANVAEVKCKGSYKFDVVEDAEDVETHQVRGGFWSSHTIHYTHTAIALFEVSAEYNGSTYELSGEFNISRFDEEKRAYLFLLELTRSDVAMEDFNKELKDNIVKQLKEKVEAEGVEEMRNRLKENNRFEIDLTIEIDKRNM